MIWLNGDLCEGEAAISADDRGLLLGESVFETLLLKHQIPQFFAAHLNRLVASCGALGLDCPYDASELRDALMRLLAVENPPARAALRVTVTGGNGGRGLVPQTGGKANLLMQISTPPPAPQTLKLVDCDIIRLAGQTIMAHKTGQYVDNILARRQALAGGGDEAVMCNQHGRIACAAAGNIFILRDAHLLTPPVSDGALPGIIRGALLALAEVDGLAVAEAELTLADLARAEAIFVTNSLNGVTPAGYGANNAVSAAQKKQGLIINEALPEFDNF